MMMKKIIALAAAGALILSAFCSCAKKQPTDGTSSAAGDITNTEPATDDRSPGTGFPSTESGEPDVTEPDVTRPASADTAETQPHETDAPDTEPAVTNSETKPAGTDTDAADTGDETDDPGEETFDPPEIKTFRYVALGDSIAAGYGLASPETERYSSIIDGYIDLLHLYESDVYNYGVNGQTSGELLTALESDSIPELHGADIVTVSIGANNVLGPSVTAMTQFTLNMLIEDETLRAAANGAAYGTFIAETNAGIESFESDLQKILEKISEYAPDAQIIVQTVYNPYKNVSLSFDFTTAVLDLSEASDSLVTRLNDIIKNHAASLGYSVADVYTAFENGSGYVNADNFDGVDIINGLDPHPTAAGHKLIADTIYDFIYTE